MKNENGNVMIISVFFIMAVLVIFIFLISIFISETTNLLHNIKTEMYSINRNGIIAVNKNLTSRGAMNYSSKEYKKYFENMIKENYGLNDSLENKDGIVEKVVIKEYEILKSNQKDPYTKSKNNNVVLHTVMEIEIKPIIFQKLLDDVFKFEIHEDVNLNEVKM